MTAVKLATTDQDINNCYAVMVQLRPHLSASDFLAKVKDQIQDGYQLAYIEVDGVPVVCAGFRYGLNLAWGKFLYVDDLVTDELQRSKGYGQQLLDWLLEQARINACAQLHLDSGVQRFDAHRFYDRQGMSKTGYHFAISV